MVDLAEASASGRFGEAALRRRYRPDWQVWGRVCWEANKGLVMLPGKFGMYRAAVGQIIAHKRKHS